MNVLVVLALIPLAVVGALMLAAGAVALSALVYRFRVALLLLACAITFEAIFGAFSEAYAALFQRGSIRGFWAWVIATATAIGGGWLVISEFTDAARRSRVPSDAALAAKPARREASRRNPTPSSPAGTTTP